MHQIHPVREDGSLVTFNDDPIPDINLSINPSSDLQFSFELMHHCLD